MQRSTHRFVRMVVLGLMVAGTVLNGRPTQAQETLDLDAYRGKVVWIDFWASWCTPCRRSFPWLNEIMARHGGEDFAVVGVNVDTERVLAEQFLREVPARFEIVYDPQGQLAKEFEVLGMPSSFLIDRDGRVISSHIGFRRDQRARYEAAITNALSN